MATALLPRRAPQTRSFRARGAPQPLRALQRRGGRRQARPRGVRQMQTCAAAASLEGAGAGAGVDVVLLSNGPGEVTSWVRPVAQALRRSGLQGASADVRVSAVLAPCPHASGGEAGALGALMSPNGDSEPLLDRVSGPGVFWRLVVALRGEGWARWRFRRRGVVIFLGGDQALALLLAARLGYACVVYAEDVARWPGALGARYALRTAALLGDVPPARRGACEVVGDLFADAVAPAQGAAGEKQREFKAAALPTADGNTSKSEGKALTVGLLVGSKMAKLVVAVPFMLAAADALAARMSVASVRFVLPLAPTASTQQVLQCASEDADVVARFGWASAAEVAEVADSLPAQAERNAMTLRTARGTHVSIVRAASGGGAAPYEVYSQCACVLTTVGTNTAELALLGVPMVVVLPTQVLEVFKGGAGGLLGLLMRLPGVLGTLVTRRVNAALLARAGAMAWPNRWAGEHVVPELVGPIAPDDAAEALVALLTDADRRKSMRAALLAVAGAQRRESEAGGAAAAVARLAAEALVERDAQQRRRRHSASDWRRWLQLPGWLRRTPPPAAGLS